MTNSSEPSNPEEPGDSVDSFLRLVAAESHEFAAAPAVLPTGTVLDERFRIHGFARRGGMGAIHRGVSIETGEAVAIKTIGRLSPGAQSRFERETRILAELSHPRIVRYVGHGATPTGILYLAMEWLEGEDLAERLQRAPLAVEESFGLFRRTCDALALAHARGIVHRDIKPANIFLCGGDPKAVKLLDFGIARLAEGAPALTTGGTRLGTLGYMSPEQACGELDVDARADVFALGCVLYECLTGRAPFASAHAVGVLAKVLQEDPTPASKLQPELNPRIDDFLSWLLSKSRESRPADAGVVLRGLHEIGSGQRIPGGRVMATLSSRGTEQRIVSVILGRKDNAESSGERLDIDEQLHAIADQFGARIAPLKGGALMMVLTGQGEANDRASQAAWCALELRNRRPELTLAVGTGLADTSGSVPVGAAIDRAAALLAAETAAQGVLLDDVTLGLVGLRFEVQRTDDVSVLLAARKDFDAPRMLMGRPTPCVGREREIRTLDEALNECVAEGVSRAVIVIGPPGIGKSRLAGEWLTRGGRGGSVRTLFACPDPTSAGSAWSLVQLLIRDAAGLREADPRDVQFERLRGHLDWLLGTSSSERVIEFIAEVMGLRRPDSSKLLIAARANPDVMREQARRALHEWFDAEAATQPLLIVAEDLHWGDTPSVEFLTDALREKPHRPLMLLALGRPEVERQFPAFCERALLRVRLPGISARAAQQLVEAVLTDKVDQETLSRLLRVTEGNPFYLEELIRRVAVGSSDWPETVMAMVQSRIERLDSLERCVLRAASVFGERCWDAGISAVLGDAADVTPVLTRLTREELLLEVPESRYAGAREYRFRHALFRDSAYAMMTHSDRCEGHGAAADWLVTNHEKDARLLADHYEATEARERASPWLLRASKKAVDAGDLLGTIDLANRGVKVSAFGPDRGRFLLLRCYAEALRGRPDLETARQSLDLLSAGTPLWWLALGILISGTGMLGKPAEAAPYVALARAAPFTHERDAALGQGIIHLVGGLVLLGQAGVAESILERARTASAEAEDQDPVLSAFLDASRCALEAVAPVNGRWQLERALIQGRRCSETLGALGAIHGQSIALYYTAVAAMHLGRYEEARDAGILSGELALRAGSHVHDPWSALFLAKALLRLNQPHDAIKAVENIRNCEDCTVRQMLLVILGEVQLQLGNPEAAEAEVTSAFHGASRRLQRLAACVLARSQLRRGDTTQALCTIELATQKPGAHGLESEIDLMNLRTECLLARSESLAAQQAASQTRDRVLQLAADIEDPELKRSFLERVSPCARAVALHEQLS